MHTNKGKNIIIFILALNLILIVILIKYIKTTSATNTNGAEVGQLISENIDEKTYTMFNNKLFPSNYIEFENKYKGSVNTDNVYLRLNVFTKFINNIEVENFNSEEKIKCYYTNNSSYIKSATTIDNLSEFVSLIKKLSVINENKKEQIRNVYFSLDKITNNSCEICVEYVNHEVLSFNVLFNESKKEFKFDF